MLLNEDTAPVTILIADDHLLMAESVSAVLQSTDRFEVTIVPDYPSALKDVTANNPDMVLLDIRMPGMQGLASIEEMLGASDDTKVVLFGGDIEPTLARASLELGVDGIIEKGMSVTSFTSAINLILSGQVFAPVHLPAAAPAGIDGDVLNDVETSILTRAADGMKNKEIATDLALTEVSVKMHMRSICRKLGARNRAHASMLSRDLGLI